MANNAIIHLINYLIRPLLVVSAGLAATYKSVIVSASRSPPGQAPNRLDFWSFVSPSGMVSFLFVFLSLGLILEAPKRFGQNPLTFRVRAGRQLLNIF